MSGLMPNSIKKSWTALPLPIPAKIISIPYQFSGEGGDSRGDQNILVLSRKWVLCIVIIVLNVISRNATQ